MRYASKKRPRKVIFPGDITDRRTVRDYRTARCAVYNLRTMTKEEAYTVGLAHWYAALNA